MVHAKPGNKIIRPTGKAMMQILVCGSRDYCDEQFMATILKCHWGLWPNATLIHGDAPGADKMAETILNLPQERIKSFPALWRKQGRAAGPIRNKRMLKELKLGDIVLAFSSRVDGRLTTGTANMCSIALKAGHKVYSFASLHNAVEKERL